MSAPEIPLARVWPVEKLVAILEAEPWLLHRRVECVNVSCEQGEWCVGCDPWGEAPCFEHPWPCPVVREQDPTFAAGRVQAAADIREHDTASRPGILGDAFRYAARIAEGSAPTVLPLSPTNESNTA